MEKIEKNERKWETLCPRVDTLENLNSKHNKNEAELEVVTTQKTDGFVNRQQQQVNNFFNLRFIKAFINKIVTKNFL